MDVERRENDWLITMSWSERAEIFAAGENSPDRALAVVADQAAVDLDGLHSAVVRTDGGDGMEIVVRSQ